MQPTQTWSVVSHALKQQSDNALQPPLVGLQVQNPNGEQVWLLQHGLAASQASPRFLHGGGTSVVDVVVVVVEVVVVVVEVVVVEVESAQNSLAVPGFMHRCRG